MKIFGFVKKVFLVGITILSGFIELYFNEKPRV